jgi:predicted component of type VI protein secretion system
LVQLTEDIAENGRKTANFAILIAGEPTVKKLIGLYGVLQEKEKEKTIINGMVKSIQDKEMRVSNCQERIIKLEKQFKEEMGDTCILCGSKLTK